MFNAFSILISSSSERLNIYDSTMNPPIVQINNSEDEDISNENVLNIADNNQINNHINNDINNNNGKVVMTQI